jgi:phosphoserine phosphatase RsbU/P
MATFEAVASAVEGVAAEDLEDLYESAPCGYLSVCAEGNIIKCNQTLLDWTGFQRPALTGTRLLDLLSRDSRMYYESHIAPLLGRQGHVDEVDIDILALDGSQLPMLANVAAKRGRGGSPVLTRLVVLRATEQRRAERSLVAARQAAERRLLLTQEHEAEVADMLEEERSLATLREQFIAVLGHDLRNPLASIRSGIDILARSDLRGRERTVLDLMQGSVTRANQLVNDVMDFARSRLGDGIPVMRGGLQSLGPVVEQVVDEMRSIAPTRTIVLDMKLPEAVDCDAPRIAQLLSNLLGNAVKHGDPSGPIRVAAITKDGELILSVANSGKAIPESAIRLLFKPFFRWERQQAQQGLGLGLHIAAQIAKAHGGTLNVTSDDTETRFTLTMPRELDPSDR